MSQQQHIQWLAISVVVGVLLGGPGGAASAQEQASTVAEGKQVSIEYTLTLDDKTVLDSNVGNDPLTYVHGTQRILPGLEKALEGMKVGESKEVTLAPEEGYGTVDKEAFIEVEKQQVPPEAHKVGARLQGQSPDGRPIRAVVSELKEDTVVLDFNHPLAGKTLHFAVKVLNIQQAPEKQSP